MLGRDRRSPGVSADQKGMNFWQNIMVQDISCRWIGYMS